VKLPAWLMFVPFLLTPTAAWLAPAPEHGIECLDESDSALLAHSFRESFRSEDGGFTWQSTSRNGQCGGFAGRPPAEAWELSDPVGPHVKYRFLPGVAIERSGDAGETWVPEVNLSGTAARLRYYARIGRAYWQTPGPFDALVQRSTGNLIVAMGFDGMLVRTPVGKWHRIAVGPYHWDELNSADRILAALSLWELWLGLILIGLTLGTLARRAPGTRVKRFALIAGWSLWAIAHIAWILVFYVVLLASLVALLTGLAGAITVIRRLPRGRIWIGLAALIPALMFWIPYVLWTQGIVSTYTSAELYAVALVVITVFIEDRYLQRFLQAASTGGSA